MDSINPAKIIEALRVWVNTPFLRVGQTELTLGGIISAVLVFAFAIILSRIVQRAFVERLAKRARLQAGTAYAIKRALHYLILFFGIILAAQCVGFNLSSLTIVLGFLSVGIGFGLQNITSNFISGLILLFERPITVGDMVTVEQPGESLIGIVNEISMRATIVKTFDNVSVIVPNSAFIENNVINWSHDDPTVRLHIPVGVAYGSDVEKVISILKSVATEHPNVLQNPEPDVWFMSFGDSSLNFELLVWCPRPDIRFKIRSELNCAIDAGFRKEGVRIPFPQRDLHLQMTPAVDRLSARDEA